MRHMHTGQAYFHVAIMAHMASAVAYTTLYG